MEAKEIKNKFETYVKKGIDPCFAYQHLQSNLKKIEHVLDCRVELSQSHGLSFRDMENQLKDKLLEALPLVQNIWLDSVFEKSVVFQQNSEDTFFQISYKISKKDEVQLSDDLKKVKRVINFEEVKG